MNIVYSLSRNLYPYLKGAIRSLLDHNDDVKIYVFAEDDELPFEIPCEHEIINVSGQTYFPPDNPNCKSQFTYMAMMRLATPLLGDGSRGQVALLVSGAQRPVQTIRAEILQLRRLRSESEAAAQR